MIPGEVYSITIPMKNLAQCFARGSRLRLAISTNFFPMIWPVPEAVELTLHTEGSALELPLRAHQPKDAELPDCGAPVAAPPGAHQIEAPESYFRIVEDAAGGRTEMQIADGGGLFRLLANGLTLRKQGYKIYSVPHGDVCAAEGRAEWAYGMQRGDWSVLSKTETTLRANSEAFVIRARMRAWEGDTLVKELEWDERIPRNNL